MIIRPGNSQVFLYTVSFPQTATSCSSSGRANLVEDDFRTYLGVIVIRRVRVLPIIPSPGCMILVPNRGQETVYKEAMTIRTSSFLAAIVSSSARPFSFSSCTKYSPCHPHSTLKLPNYPLSYHPPCAHYPFPYLILYPAIIRFRYQPHYYKQLYPGRTLYGILKILRL